MVFVLVAALCCLYISQLVEQRIRAANENGDFVANEVFNATRETIESGLGKERANFSDPQVLHDAAVRSLQNDRGLRTLLESVIGYSTTVFDIAITDTDRRAILHSDPSEVGKIIPSRPDLAAFRNASFIRQLRMVYGPPQVYTITIPLERNDVPFVFIRVGIRSTFLRSDLQPQLHRAIFLAMMALLLSLVFAAILSNLALQPLEMISRRLDQLTSGEVSIVVPQPAQSKDEYGVVTTKIERIGRQMQDVKEVFTALKENLDQIMANLQDGIVLFTKDGRAILVSASVEKFFLRPRSEILGNDVPGIFDQKTELGRAALQAFEQQKPISGMEVEGADGHRVQVQLDFIEESGESLGALLTLRDAESVRRIEDEIEFSRRLAAIGRLTSGVAHEVKNPINAIVVHLELLKQKLQSPPEGVNRHMEIISSEVRRLDRVVQTLVEFSRPVELRLAESDLGELLSDVVTLASPDFETHSVRVDMDLPLPPVRVVANIDVDLIKQAVLNIVINGAQAMPEGGTLTVSLAVEGAEAIVTIRDQGVGISAEIRDKIFNLYFTTKKEGSGIGLAMAYRILQLHSGSIAVRSEVGQGSTFTLRLPAMLMSETKPGEPSSKIGAMGDGQDWVKVQ